jgi:integration host factor subunit alpha
MTGVSMTKADFVERVMSETGFTKGKSFDLVESVISIMKDKLAEGEPLKISGFGNFVVKEKHDRRGRNPHTGEDITIDARRVLTFKPSMVLKDAMNQSCPAK